MNSSTAEAENPKEKNMPEFQNKFSGQNQEKQSNPPEELISVIQGNDKNQNIIYPEIVKEDTKNDYLLGKNEFRINKKGNDFEHEFGILVPEKKYSKFLEFHPTEKRHFLNPKRFNEYFKEKKMLHPKKKGERGLGTRDS